MASPGSKRWRHQQPDSSSDPTTPINGVLNQALARDRYRVLNWSPFQVPSSDSLIRAHTRSGVPVYPLPNENDGFTVVRRYLYDVLTRTGWGISEKYPAAIRATVEGWYGHGGYFRAQCAAENGLDLCPITGKNGEGNEVDFDKRLREIIRDCVRHESSVLLYQEVRLEDSVSEADTCVDDATPDIIAQEKDHLNQGEAKDIYPRLRLSLEYNEDSISTAAHEDQSDDVDLSALPAHHNASARFARPIGLKTHDIEELASFHRSTSSSRSRPKPPSENMHNVTFQIPAPKYKQLKQKERPSASSRATDELIEGRKSVIGCAASSHQKGETPDHQSENPRQDEIPVAYKHARRSLTLPIEQQMNRRKSAKAIEHRLQRTRQTSRSISSIYSVRYESLPVARSPRIQDQHVLVEAADVAKRAIALNLDVNEARHLNHHERKKRGIFARVCAKLGAKKG